jgi:cell division protein FtsI (penicillin-binding protein 3)
MVSFLGTLPAHDPQYVIFAMLDDPKATKETYGFAAAGWNVTPMVQKIMARMIALYGMPPYDENDITIQEKLHVEYKIEHDAET